MYAHVHLNNIQYLSAYKVTNRKHESTELMKQIFTSWKNTFRIPSDENKTSIIQSRSVTLELLDGTVHLFLAAKY